MTERQEIILTEWERVDLPERALTLEQGKMLHLRFHEKVDVHFPSPRTGMQWRLRALGWVGVIPLGDTLLLRLVPKLPLRSIFSMLELAYGLKSFELHRGLAGCSSLPEAYEHLASILARRILDRCRRGLYRNYRGCREELTVLRGRLLFDDHLKRHWDPRIPCRFQIHDGNNDENAILAWTLHVLLRSGVITERSRPVVGKAYRLLTSAVELRPFTAKQCLNRSYDRLCDDYAPLHALCHFFLDQITPGHDAGTHSMLPFVVNMARLFERFLAEWFRLHLPPHLNLRSQEAIYLDRASRKRASIDMVIYERKSKRAIAVLDAKYKAPDSPSPSDIYQIFTYARLKNCDRGVLIYPTLLPSPFENSLANEVHVQSFYFPLDPIPTDATAFSKIFIEHVN